MVKCTLYKKPIIFIIGFLYFITLSKAQDMAFTKQLLEQKDYARAKESVDSLVQLNSSNAEGWLLKAVIYNAINKDAGAKYLVADGRMDAFQALQKAEQLNSDFTNTQLKQSNYSLPFDLYNGYTNEAINYFNAGAERNDKLSYSEALSRFKKAGQVGKYITDNGWGLSATDTNNLYYCAKAAINAGKEEDAFLFAKKIADAGITQSQANKKMESIYQWLAYYYKKQQDGEHLVKYSQLGMQLYPSSVYFDLLLIDWQRQQKEYNNLLAGYQVLFKKQPANSKYQLAYLNDLFNYLYESKLEITDRNLYQAKLSQGLLQFNKVNPAMADGRLLIAKMYINQANDLGHEVLLRSTTDAKVLNAFKTRQINLLIKSNEYLRAIVTKYCKADIATFEEAKELLKSNLQFIRLLKGFK